MSKRPSLFRSIKLFTLSAVIAVSSVITFLAPTTADAAVRPDGVAFFNNVYVGASSRAVIWYDGMPYGGDSLPTFNTKDEFISHIKMLLRGDTTSWQWRNQAGAEYIIQRMRAGSDFGRPDAADVADWETRIRQSNVTIANEYATDEQTSGFVTVGGYDGGSDSVGNRDDVAYTKSSGINFGETLAFYQNGSLVFRIRYNCGNPLGNLGGLAGENYNLNPTISGSPSTAESGGTVSLTPTVNNTGTTSSNSTNQWQLTRFQVAPGAPVPGGGTNGSIPTSHYSNGAVRIDGGTRSFPTGLTNLNVGSQVLGDVPVGTRLCYGLSVQPITQADGSWRHSNPFCVTIAKKPKVVVEGGDVFVGKGTISNILTSTTRKNVSGQDRSFGSWGEYAVSATGTITGMASGAGYSGGATNDLFCSVSYLTITNAGSSTCSPGTTKGNYALGAALPDISARFSQTQPMGGGPFNVSAVANNVYATSGNIFVDASGEIQPGRWVVINAPGSTVTIRDNIVYSGAALASIADIPQVVIIANNIDIEGDVSRIDAWLIASGNSGRINTCTDVANATQLNATRCANTLTVNGPVAARHLLLHRTAGSGTGVDSGIPAERFNLRPDAYLWATYFNSQAGRLQTVSTKELPPRF